MEWDGEDAFFLRLAETIRRAGGSKSVSMETGIPVGTLNKYLAATSVPSFTNVKKIAGAGGVSLDWLAGSRGSSKQSSVAGKRAALAAIGIMQAVGEIVERLHVEAGIRLSISALRKETSARAKALVDRVDDPTDADELMSMLDWLEIRIRKDLKNAIAHPGTGKHSAS